MLPSQESPIAITALTLRGIGSYVRGARLDITPLTVLCGENGSGKSTWLKALNVLRRSLKAGRLPYGFDVEDFDPQNIQLTNAFFHLAPSDDIEGFVETDDDAFGPPGTIGLEMVVTRDTGRLNDRFSAPNQYLRESAWAKGTRLRIRIAHPTYWNDTTAIPCMTHLIELTINDDFVVRLESERDPFQRFQPGISRPRRSKPYRLCCSRAFMSYDGVDPAIIYLASIKDLINDNISLLVEPDEIELVEVAFLLNDIESRIRDTLRMALDSYFYLGAIRNTHVGLTLIDPTQSHSSSLQPRHVGNSGEYAWQREFEFGFNQMRKEAPPYFRPEDFSAIPCWKALKEIHVADALPPISQLMATRRLRGLRQVWKHGDESCKAQIRNLFDSPEEIDKRRTPDLVASLCNSVLEDGTLFDLQSFGRVISTPSGGDDYILPPEIDAYCQYDNEVDVAQLSTSELRRLNYLLVEQAFRFIDDGLVPCEYRCTFIEYTSNWLRNLMKVRLTPRRERPPTVFMPPFPLDEFGWEDDFEAGAPFLIEPDPTPQYGVGTASDPRGIARLVHPCFGEGDQGTVQPPQQFSAAFHQVFPIVVQLGLIRKNELIGIENPEVHLHPALQRQLTEMILAHARSGRRIIVETHSDLFLRRLIRAILQEEIGQSQLNIFFASLTNEVTVGTTPFFGSRLEAIRTDAHGHIINWPSGFLDEDVRESQRLLDIMYGGASFVERDDDE